MVCSHCHGRGDFLKGSAMKKFFGVALLFLGTSSVFGQQQTAVVNQNMIPPGSQQPMPPEWMQNGYREQFTRTDTHDVYPFRDYNYPGNHGYQQPLNQQQPAYYQQPQWQYQRQNCQPLYQQQYCQPQQPQWQLPYFLGGPRW